MIPDIHEFSKHFGLDKVKPEALIDCRLEHILHIFEGYRSAAQNDPETEPYSPGGARDISYQIGRQIYEYDMKGISYVDDTPIKFPEF